MKRDSPLPPSDMEVRLPTIHSRILGSGGPAEVWKWWLLCGGGRPLDATLFNALKPFGLDPLPALLIKSANYILVLAMIVQGTESPQALCK